ncbi:MAG: glycoside hydrolase family 28 protein [Bacteroidetes bacterium]|nr:glycoside hydrolase family 28 protein [Bacteroidota bacterium]
MRKRELLKLLLLLIFTISCANVSFEKQAENLNEKAWEKVDTILTRINAPTFIPKNYYVKNYINNNEGRKAFVNAVNKAILDCNIKGGGNVIISEGEYISNGPIHLLSNVNLHLEDGAILKFGVVPLDYTPLVLVRWEGTLCYNYSPLIYAHNQKNIAVTGKGIIDGQTQLGWHKWKRGNDGKNQDADKERLRQFGNDVTTVETRVFGHGFLDLDGDGKDDGYGDDKDHYLRPTGIEFIECENILLEDFTIRNTPFWTIHPVFSKNITARNLDIQAGTTNDDGFDPDSCTDVLLENSTISTNDDAISIKAGRDQDAWDRLPCENIIVRNNNLTSGVNGFCIGSEMSGGVRNVFVYDNKIPKASRGINFKCNLDRGGQVEKIYIKNIELGYCENELFIFRMDYHGYRGNNYPTKFNDFFVSNINCDSVGATAFKIVGVESQTIQRVYLKNFDIRSTVKEAEIKYAEEVIFSNIKIDGKQWKK